MNRFATAAFAAATLLASSSVFAQTPAPTQAPSSSSTPSMLSGVTIGGGGGVTFTKKTGGQVYGEIVSKEYWPKVQFSVEGGWMSSVVNAHRIDAAGAIADYLAQTQGQPASASVKVPAGYGAFNVRYTVYRKPRYDIYALGGVGFAVTSPKTTFLLGGTDVSGSMRAIRRHARQGPRRKFRGRPGQRRPRRQAAARQVGGRRQLSSDTDVHRRRDDSRQPPELHRRAEVLRATA